MQSNRQGKTLIGVVLVVFIYFIVFQSLSMSSQLKQLKQEVRYLQHSLDDVSEELNILIKKDLIVLDSEYTVEKTIQNDTVLGNVQVELTSNTLESFDDTVLLYRVTYDNSKSESYDYSNEIWNSVDISNNSGTSIGNISIPFSCDYELKVAYTDNGNTKYEKLPSLDLYSKAEQALMKDINVYEFKRNKLKFDVQIVKDLRNNDIDLTSAFCNVYHANKIVHSVDILKENEKMNRKEPRMQMEHEDGAYWFIIEEVDTSNISDLDESQLLIEVVLKDSIKNTYKLERRVN